MVDADPMQLFDELSMIYTTCIMNYATFSFQQTRVFSNALAFGLTSLAAFITVRHDNISVYNRLTMPLLTSDQQIYYHYLQDPTFHQNAYAILTAVVLFRSMYIMEVNLRPSLRARYGTIVPKGGLSAAEIKGERAANAGRDREILHTMWWMIALGLSIFLGGFGIWTLDNEYCSTLRRWRHEVGLPWGLLLEGHGWWLVENPSTIPLPDILLILVLYQAPDDRHWCILLHCMVYLATTLFKRKARRV
jgi:dihydroceramidase